MSQARCLVLIRAGKDHCFSALTRTPRTNRSWDLALSIYDDTPVACGTQVEWVHRHPGGKWSGIWQFFAEHGAALNGYDYYWLVDDDVEIDAPGLERLLAHVRHHRFELAQPALTPDSYYSHRLTLACPGLRHRHTNLVEIMAPLLSAALLGRILPLIRDTDSGFGLDWLWQRMVPEPHRQIAIIDLTPVRHARPLRQHLRNAMASKGATPEQERSSLSKAHGLRRLHGVAIAALTSDGQCIQSRMRLALYMARGYWSIRQDITRRPWTAAQTVMLIYRQLFSPLGYTHPS
jgi:hypothetical protein